MTIRIKVKEIQTCYSAQSSDCDEIKTTKKVAPAYAEWCAEQLKAEGYDVCVDDEQGGGCFITDSTAEAWACEDLPGLWEWYTPEYETKGR